MLQLSMESPVTASCVCVPSSSGWTFGRKKIVWFDSLHVWGLLWFRNQLRPGDYAALGQLLKIKINKRFLWLQTLDIRWWHLPWNLIMNVYLFPCICFQQLVYSMESLSWYWAPKMFTKWHNPVCAFLCIWAGYAVPLCSAPTLVFYVHISSISVYSIPQFMLWNVPPNQPGPLTRSHLHSGRNPVQTSCRAAICHRFQPN